MVLTVGTDCSGVGMAALALAGLGLAYRHVFASDWCHWARATLMANTPAEVVYFDIRDRSLVAPVVVDLYIVGFPCQPFSLAGLRDGFAARDGNGLIFFHVLRYIDRARPKAFVLENVVGLLSAEEGQCFSMIWHSLLSLGNYNVHFQVMNTKDHGVPQNRPHVFLWH